MAGTSDCTNTEDARLASLEALIVFWGESKMINQEEIKAKALEFDIHHPNIERDTTGGRHGGF